MVKDERANSVGMSVCHNFLIDGKWLPYENLLLFRREKEIHTSPNLFIYH